MASKGERVADVMSQAEIAEIKDAVGEISMQGIDRAHVDHLRERLARLVEDREAEE